MNEVLYSPKAGAAPVARTITHFTREIRLAHLEDIANALFVQRRPKTVNDEPATVKGEFNTIKEESMEIEATPNEAPTPESQYVCTLITASYNRNLEMYN